MISIIVNITTRENKNVFMLCRNANILIIFFAESKENDRVASVMRNEKNERIKVMKDAFMSNVFTKLIRL